MRIMKILGSLLALCTTVVLVMMPIDLDIRSSWRLMLLWLIVPFVGYGLAYLAFEMARKRKD